MNDPRIAKARQAGRRATAPTYVGWWVMLGGALGAALGAWATPWSDLARAAFGLRPADLPSLGACLAPCLVGVTLGATAGLVLGQLTLDPTRIAWRGKAPRSKIPRRTGLAALGVALVVLLPLPMLLPAATRGDPGRAVLVTPIVVLAVLLVAALPLAIWARSRAQTVFREHEAPWPPPRRDEDALPPEVKAALAAFAQPETLVMDMVVTDGVYAAAILHDPPTLVAHGGAHLIAMAEEAGVPISVDPARAAQLAMVPTGERIAS
jgi:hypothetical protein